MNKKLFRLLRFTGLPLIFREFIQRHKVTILLFHDLRKETTEKVLGYLYEKYTIIDLNDLIRAVETNATLPVKSMILTFDDGHIGNYEILPVIKKMNIPITIFLCASIINTHRHFWFRFYNATISAASLKRMSNKERLETLSKAGFEQEKEFDIPQALQKSQIDEMKSHINFQSHTLFHPILPECDNEVAKAEIFKSKEILENQYGLKINSISYPNGDYSERDIQLVKNAGYKCGVTVDFGYNTPATDLFRLKRISVNDSNDINEIIVKASGLWAFLKTLNGRRQEHGFSNETDQ